MRGWERSNYGKLFHYFIDGIPLCNGAGLPVGFYWTEDGNDESDENCKKCQKLLKPIRKREKLRRVS